MGANVQNLVGTETSKAAAQSVSSSISDTETEILKYIYDKGGATRDEVVRDLGLKHQTATARVKGLIEKGLLSPQPVYRLTRSGRKAEVVAVSSRYIHPHPAPLPARHLADIAKKLRSIFP